jgi:ABC-type glycerol-3-phosphate transport system permease component
MENMNNTVTPPVETVDTNGVKTQQPKVKGLRMPYEKPLAQAIILGVVIFCLLFSFLPLFLTVVNAFKLDDQVKVDAFSLPLFSTIAEATDRNFTRAWEVLSPYYGKTILIALIGAIFETGLSALLAYILVVKNFFFKEFIFMLFISVLLVPSIIGYPILIPLIRDTFKVGDTYFGYLLPMIGGAQVTGMFLFRTFFSQQPKSLYESARLDGANDIVLFTRITLPLALPIVLYHFVGCFSGIYNEYLWASLIMDSNQTVTTIMHSVVASGEIKYGAAYAMYLISSLPLIVTTIISMKYFKSGEFAAGLKL